MLRLFLQIYEQNPKTICRFDFSNSKCTYHRVCLGPQKQIYKSTNRFSNHPNATTWNTNPTVFTNPPWKTPPNHDLEVITFPINEMDFNLKHLDDEFAISVEAFSHEFSVDQYCAEVEAECSLQLD